MYRYAISIMLMLTTLMGGVKAQPFSTAEADSTGNGFHLMLGSSLLFSRAEVQPLTWVAPSFQTEVNNRLRLGGGFVLVGSPQRIYQFGAPRSFAPRRHTTHYAALHAEVEYSVSPTTMVWGALYAAGGWAQPWFAPMAEGMPIGLVALCGGVDHQLSSGSWLSLSFEVVHDRYGTGLWVADPYYGLWGRSAIGYGSFGSAFAPYTHPYLW